jgi:hypothetical protein
VCFPEKMLVRLAAYVVIIRTECLSDHVLRIALV